MNLLDDLETHSGLCKLLITTHSSVQAELGGEGVLGFPKADPESRTQMQVAE